MHSPPRPLFIPLLLLPLLLLFPPTLSHSWHRRHIGRVIYATPHPSTPHLIVATSLHILASLDIKTGQLHWRYVPFHQPHTTVAPLIALGVKHNHPSYHTLYAQYGDMLLHLDAQNGSLVHTRRMCGKYIQANQAQIFVPHCQQGGDHMNGVVIPEVLEGPLEWQMPGGRLLSHQDARLVWEGEENWSREEGLAYSTGAWVGEDGIVVVTELGAVYGVARHGGGDVMWSNQLAPDRCSIVGGRNGVVGVVCAGKVWAVKVAGGGVEGGIGDAIVRGGVDDAVGGICVWGLDSQGQKIGVGKDCGDRRMWVEWKVGGMSVRGVVEGAEVWKVAIPEGGKIMKVIISASKHGESVGIRPAAVRVTKNRKLLYKDVDGEYGLVFWKNEEGNDGFYEMLVDLSTGSTIEMAKHDYARGEVVGVGGEGWFVFGSWNKRMMAQEIHILELYERVGMVSRVQDAIHQALTGVLGERIVERLDLPHTTPHRGICPVDPGKPEENERQCLANSDGTEKDALSRTPAVRRSSLLANQRILEMDVTQTELGLTEPSLAMTLESGQVTFVSKVFLDAWSARGRDEKTIPENIPMYRPLLNLLSSSRESKYMAEGMSLPGIKGTAFAPIRGKESASRAVVFGVDLLYEDVQPAGTYDSLPLDFSYSAVVGMVFALGAAFFYTQHLRSKAKLLQLWE